MGIGGDGEKFDVAIICGGVSGISSIYRLRRLGLRLAESTGGYPGFSLR